MLKILAKGGGKEQPLNTFFLTPTGFKRNKDLKVGDEVCNPDGTVSKIIQTHPIERKKKYVLHFRDGRKAECGANHIWYGAKGKNTYQNSWTAIGCTKNAEEIYQITKNEKRKSKREWFRIPLPDPVYFHDVNKKNRTVDPYLLGVLLGDGCITGNSQTKISTADSEHMLEQFSEYTFRVVDFSKYNLGVNKNLFDLFFTGEQWKQLDNDLDGLGLLGKRSDTKFIPEAYKVAPKEVRLAVIQGLMDTDGTVDGSTKNVKFSSTSVQLAEDLVWLARSLGFYASIQVKEARDKVEKDGTVYHCKEGRTVCIRTYEDSQLFRLSRHIEKVKKGVTRPLGVSVVDVTIEGEEDMRCITVDNPNGLYITEDFVVTHNSFLARYAAFILATAVPHLQIYIFRRTYSEVRGNFLFGKDGLLALVQPLVDNGDAVVNLSDNRIDFCNGAQIYLRHMQNPDKDIESIRGRDIHVGFLDESTQWLTRDVYNQFRTCMRCALDIDYKELQKDYPFITEGYFPRVYMLTNPGGRGHLFHMEMFLNSMPPNTDVQMPPEEGGMIRRFIPAFLEDNTALLRLDPNYKNKLLGSGRHVEKMLKGDWSTPEGACLSEEWDSRYNLIEPFVIPPDAIIDRTYDFGTRKPWACIYTYETTGEEITLRDGTKRAYPSGTLFIIDEIYGWNGRADEGDHKTARQQGKAIKEFERSRYWGKQIQAGPSDGSIFNQMGMDTTINDEILEGYNSITDDPDNYWNTPTSVLFTPADKSKGSIAKGLALVQAYLVGAHNTEDGRWSEESGLIFFTTCKQCIRTLPTLPYDMLDQTVYDSKAEDHLMDCVRYRVFTNRPKYQRLTLLGL